MATQETGAPAWAGAFQNILNLEESRGFDNKAVMGGLDKFVARWADERPATPRSLMEVE